MHLSTRLHNYPHSMSITHILLSYRILTRLKHVQIRSVMSILNKYCTSNITDDKVNYIKIKVTLVQALMLCTGCMVHRGSRGIALLFHDDGTRREWGVSVTPRPLFTPEKDPVPIVQEAGWAPGPVWTGAEDLTPTGIRSPYRPACSQSLYRLRYPAHKLTKYCTNNITDYDTEQIRQ